VWRRGTSGANKSVGARKTREEGASQVPHILERGKNLGGGGGGGRNLLNLMKLQVQRIRSEEEIIGVI